MADIYTNFTQRDYTSMFQRLLEILATEVPELTDRNHSDGGVSLIRLLARSVDMLSFYIDEAFIESYLETARFRQSLIDIGSVVECRPNLSAPAATSLTFTRVEPLSGSTYVDVNILAGTPFSRSDGVEYICMDNVFIPAATMTGTIPVLQLVKHTVSITKHDFDYYGFKRLRYNMGTGVVSGYTSLYDVDGEWYWTEVNSFYRSVPSSTHFTVELYADEFNGENDTVFLTVGDGWYGSNDLPHNIMLTYYTTSGSLGNGGSDTVTLVPSDLIRHITVTNPIACTGGADPEGTERFRARVPRLVQTQRRGLTELDYTALVKSIPGVLDCQAVSRSSDANWPYMYMMLYVLPEGGGLLSEYLYNKILSECKEWGHLGDWSLRYVINSATINTQDVSMRVGKAVGFQWAAVDSAIRAVVTDFFKPENIMLGTNISFSALNRAVSAIQSVDWVEFASPTSNIVSGVGNTYILGDITIAHA